MARPDSLDPRERVVAAVEKKGMSCRAAAAQFGVGRQDKGSCAPGKMGGHKPKAIAGEHRTWLLQRAEERDFTLRGLSPNLRSGTSRWR
jgi:putative transposase